MARRVPETSQPKIQVDISRMVTGAFTSTRHPEIALTIWSPSEVVNRDQPREFHLAQRNKPSGQIPDGLFRLALTLQGSRISTWAASIATLVRTLVVDQRLFDLGGACPPTKRHRARAGSPASEVILLGNTPGVLPERR